MRKMDLGLAQSLIELVQRTNSFRSGSVGEICKRLVVEVEIAGLAIVVQEGCNDVDKASVQFNQCLCKRGMGNCYAAIVSVYKFHHRKLDVYSRSPFANRSPALP